MLIPNPRKNDQQNKYNSIEVKIQIIVQLEGDSKRRVNFYFKTEVWKVVAYKIHTGIPNCYMGWLEGAISNYCIVLYSTVPTLAIRALPNPPL